jgi:hypothetical protein
VDGYRQVLHRDLDCAFRRGDGVQNGEIIPFRHFHQSEPQAVGEFQEVPSRKPCKDRGAFGEGSQIFVLQQNRFSRGGNPAVFTDSRKGKNNRICSPHSRLYFGNRLPARYFCLMPHQSDLRTLVQKLLGHKNRTAVATDNGYRNSFQSSFHGSRPHG